MLRLSRLITTAVFKRVLTRTRLDTGGPKVELLVWVGFGLKCDRVVDGGWGTVLLTHTTVIEVTARLARKGGHATPEMTKDCLTTHWDKDKKDEKEISGNVCVCYM